MYANGTNDFQKITSKDDFFYVYDKKKKFQAIS